MSGLKSLKSWNLSQSTSSKHIASSIRSSMASSNAKSFMSNVQFLRDLVFDVKYQTKASSLPKTYWTFLKCLQIQDSLSCERFPKGPRIWDRKIWPSLDSPDKAKAVVIFRRKMHLSYPKCTQCTDVLPVCILCLTTSYGLIGHLGHLPKTLASNTWNSWSADSGLCGLMSFIELPRWCWKSSRRTIHHKSGR